MIKFHTEVAQRFPILWAGGEISLTAKEIDLKGAKLTGENGTTLLAEVLRAQGLKLRHVDSFSSKRVGAFTKTMGSSGEGKDKFSNSEIEGGTVKIEAKEKHLSYGVSQEHRGVFRALNKNQTAPAWMEGSGVAIMGENKGWDDKKTTLTEGGAALVALAASVATMGAGSALGTSLSTALATQGGTAAAAISAGTSALVMGSASSMAVHIGNNEFDFAKSGGEFAKARNLRGIVKGAALSAGIAGISSASGLGDVSGASGGDRFQAMAEQSAIRGGLRAAMGEKNIIASEIGSFGLASSQMLVGDVGSLHGLADGGVAKTMFHAGVGAIYGGITTGDATSGAIGGALGESVGGGLGSVLAGSAALLAGGDVGQASMVATSAHENNFLKHIPKTVKIVGELVKQFVKTGGKEVAKSGPKAIESAGQVTKIDGSKIIADITVGKANLPTVVDKITNPVIGSVGKTGPPAPESITIMLKPKPGSSNPSFVRKVETTQALAQSGKLEKTIPSKRDAVLIRKYRADINKRIKQQYGETNPELVPKLQQKAEKYYDVDHIHELQLGGQDVLDNLQLLDKSVNRSIGAQVMHQLKNIPVGTKIKNVVIKKN